MKYKLRVTSYELRVIDSQRIAHSLKRIGVKYNLLKRDMYV